MGDQQFEELTAQLMRELSTYGIDCAETQARLMIGHLQLVIEKNKIVNLTRILDPVDGVTLHIVDSLLPLACDAVRSCDLKSFVDIGTGAGFPGVPFGILTSAKGTLVDSVNKKVSAVNEFIASLELPNLSALHARVEELPSQGFVKEDIVIARAVAQSRVLIEYATPLLRKNGILILEKALLSDEELEDARLTADICGLSLVSRETFELPRELGHREILVYEKSRPSRVKLPRRVGLAKSEPLFKK